MSTTDPSATSATLGQKNLSTIHAVAQSLAIGPMFSTALLLGLISNPVTGAGWNSALAVLLAGLCIGLWTVAPLDLLGVFIGPVLVGAAFTLRERGPQFRVQRYQGAPRQLCPTSLESEAAERARSSPRSTETRHTR